MSAEQLPVEQLLAEYGTPNPHGPWVRADAGTQYHDAEPRPVSAPNRTTGALGDSPNPERIAALTAERDALLGQLTDAKAEAERRARDARMEELREQARKRVEAAVAEQARKLAAEQPKPTPPTPEHPAMTPEQLAKAKADIARCFSEDAPADQVVPQSTVAADISAFFRRDQQADKGKPAGFAGDVQRYFSRSEEGED